MDDKETFNFSQLVARMTEAVLCGNPGISAEAAVEKANSVAKLLRQQRWEREKASIERQRRALEWTGQ